MRTAAAPQGPARSDLHLVGPCCGFLDDDGQLPPALARAVAAAMLAASDEALACVGMPRQAGSMTLDRTNWSN